MNDTYIVLTISIVATIVQAIFWRWVSSISDSSKDNAKKYDDVKTELSNFKIEVSRSYQSKSDAHKDLQLITDMLKEIKADVKQLNDKLDKKADKP